MEAAAVPAVAERADVRRPGGALLPPAGREAGVLPGYFGRQRVGVLARDAEASRGDVRRAVGVAVLQVGSERGQAAKSLPLATPGAPEGEVARGERVGDGAAGLTVPLQEEGTRTSGAQLLLHHSSPGEQRNRTCWCHFRFGRFRPESLDKVQFAQISQFATARSGYYASRNKSDSRRSLGSSGSNRSEPTGLD